MLFILVLLLGLLSSPTVVQSKSAAGTLVVPQDGGRDPFSATKKMKKGRQAIKEVLGFSAEPSKGPASMPALALRGFIDAPHHQALALIEVVGSGVYMVKKGDTLSIQIEGKPASLKVHKINKLSIQVGFGNLGQVVIVR